MRNKRTTAITAALNSMGKQDMYSLLLFALYRMKDNPEFLTLSELCYIIEGDNLSKFLGYFGGMTVTFPTIEEFNLLTKALLLFQYVNIEDGDFEESLKAIKTEDISEEEIKNMYSKLLEAMNDYDFNKHELEE